MKVLHVIPAVAPRYGGPSQAILGICRALVRQGVETLIATTDADGPGQLPVERETVVAFQSLPTIFFRRQWSEAYKYSRPLATWLTSNVADFDLVHIHAVFSHASQAAAAACRRRRIPYVVRPLGNLDPWSMRQKRPQKLLLWHLGVKQMLRGAAAIHYTTPQEQQLVEATLGLSRGVVIPLGVDIPELYEPTESGSPARAGLAPAPRPYLLVLGRIHPKKGLELLLEAFLSLIASPEFECWRLVIAGSGEDRYVREIKRLVDQRAGQDRVVFTGWLEGEAKASALRHAAVMVLPSQQENFAVSVIESLAYGVPVIVSPHVNTADAIQAGGAGWVTPLELEGLRATLAVALRDEDERKRRGAAGRALVISRFFWGAVGEELVQLYRSFANGARSSSAKEVDCDAI